MSCGQLPTQVILVPQLSAELLKEGPVQYLSLTEEQLQRLTSNATALVKAGQDTKLQENQVIDFLALNEEVQFIKTESCVPSPDGDAAEEYGSEVGVNVMDTFDASPLLHETSKDVALSNLPENLATLPALHADENAESNGEYDTEDLLLAQLHPQNQHGTTQGQGQQRDVVAEEVAEVDDDERAASEYLNDGQLYLEKSKRQLHHHTSAAIKCDQQMDCSSTNLLDAPTADGGDVSCSNEAQSEVAEVSSTTLEPIVASSSPPPAHPVGAIATTMSTPPTLSIVDPVVSSPQTMQLGDNKIRVVSFNGANILTSAGEPVLLGNILLVPETPTVKLQIVQEGNGGSLKEVSVRSVGSESNLTQNALGLNGLTLGNISLLSQNLALQNGISNSHQDKKSQRPFQCKLCSATFNRLGNYTRHQKIHTVRSEEDERFHCEECGKSFIQRCDLTRHLHVHTGTEPHRCNLCGKGYIRHSDLVTHQRFHNKEKPFLCPHCQKGFSQRGDLNRHLRSIHLQIRPLTCGHCQKKFAKEATLIRHMRTSHREMLLQSLLLKNGGDATSISEALITGTGDICTPTALSGQD